MHIKKKLIKACTLHNCGTAPQDWLGKQATNKVNNAKTMRGIEWFLDKTWVLENFHLILKSWKHL